MNLDDFFVIANRKLLVPLLLVKTKLEMDPNNLHKRKYSLDLDIYKSINQSSVHTCHKTTNCEQFRTKCYVKKQQH